MLGGDGAVQGVALDALPGRLAIDLPGKRIHQHLRCLLAGVDPVLDHHGAPLHDFVVGVDQPYYFL